MTNEDFRRIAQTVGTRSRLDDADLAKLSPEDRVMVRKEQALSRQAKATPAAQAATQPPPADPNKEPPQ